MVFYGMQFGNMLIEEWTVCTLSLVPTLSSSADDLGILELACHQLIGPVNTSWRWNSMTLFDVFTFLSSSSMGTWLSPIFTTNNEILYLHEALTTSIYTGLAFPPLLMDREPDSGVPEAFITSIDSQPEITTNSSISMSDASQTVHKPFVSAALFSLLPISDTSFDIAKLAGQELPTVESISWDLVGLTSTSTGE